MNLSDRMKSYEFITNSKLVPRLPIIVRIDGRAFHTFCRNMKRPYDKRMSDCMIETTKYLVEETSAIIGYTQSDEINLILYNENPQSQLMFDGRIQKLSSIIASMTTVMFAWHYKNLFSQYRFPTFDCRVFNVPSKEEAVNILIWRELDATRNSITMAAQSVYSHKELMNKNTSEMQEMLFQKGINWNDYPAFFKRGSYIRKFQYEKQVFDIHHLSSHSVIRTKTEKVEVPILLSIANRIEFIFNNEEIKLNNEEKLN